jgi:hypothetical protein
MVGLGKYLSKVPTTTTATLSLAAALPRKDARRKDVAHVGEKKQAANNVNAAACTVIGTNYVEAAC